MLEVGASTDAPVRPAAAKPPPSGICAIEDPLGGFSICAGYGRLDDSNCSGRSSSGVISTMRPPFRNRTRSTCISASH